MSFIDKLVPITNIYDYVQQLWLGARVQKFLATSIFVVFVCSLVAIELNREGFLPSNISLLFPTNHFHAINLAFTLILAMEVVSLIFNISCSLSRALGKQFEIMALILLRDTFKKLTDLPEPVSLANNLEPIINISISASAALVIFVCLGIYHNMRNQQKYIKTSEQRMHYVISKKVIALILLCIITIIAVRDFWLFIFFGQEDRFFETIYTVLIFADVTLVLVSQRFMPSFHAVFRNSGFVIATLIMRLSLSATPPWNSVACIFASIYVLTLIWATNKFTPIRVRPPEPEPIAENNIVHKTIKRKAKLIHGKLNTIFKRRKKHT